MATELTLPAPRGFSLPHAVCSYGYFMLAPNQWRPGPTPRDGALVRPLRDAAGRTVTVAITQHRPTGALRIQCDRTLGRADHAPIKSAVSRMLRLDESFTGFHKLHAEARKARFDRLFRSPTLFEDIVKTITSCNVAWSNTISMNRLLVEHVGAGGDFPTPAELARWKPEKLQPLCKVGYRAKSIIELARSVDGGDLNLEALQNPDLPTDDLYKALLSLHGVGPYAANNILKDMGRYDRMAVDSETIRHFKDHHGITGDPRHVARKAQEHYERYAPHQFLAYWFELWGAYETRFGKAASWSEQAQAAVTRPPTK